ncbi:MAG: TfoX/Sxy family protein [Magnetococcales bacterium]|nr:TfoX/Sxy family protein [Magnetococcales bacterium]
MHAEHSTRRSEFVAFVTELISFVDGLRIKAMFGGYGLYQGDRMFAIILHDRLYFKTDAISRGEFAAKGLQPFTYTARGKDVTLSYFEAPTEVYDEQEAMACWVHKALAAAGRAATIRKQPKTARRQQSDPL